MTADGFDEAPNEAPQSPKNSAKVIDFDITKCLSFHRLADTKLLGTNPRLVVRNIELLAG
jgi:hypothetical protein